MRALLWGLLLGLSGRAWACVCSQCAPEDRFCYVVHAGFTGKELGFGCADSPSELGLHFDAPPSRASVGARWCGIGRNETVLCICAQKAAPPTSPPPPTTTMRTTTTTEGPPTQFVHEWYLQPAQRTATPSTAATPSPLGLYPLRGSSVRLSLLSFTTAGPSARPSRPPRPSPRPPTTPPTTPFVAESRKIENYQSAIDDKLVRERSGAGRRRGSGVVAGLAVLVVMGDAM